MERAGTLTDASPTAQWPGVRAGPVVLVKRAASQSQCEVIGGMRVCPREQSFNVTETEMYRPGIGAVAYEYRNQSSFSGGGFSSSVEFREDVGLVSSSLWGDVASYELESEPNDTVGQAQRVALPGAVLGDAREADPGPELRYYDTDRQLWFRVAMHDLYVFTMAERREVTVRLEVRGDADLNFLLMTLFATNQVANILLDGERAELVVLSPRRGAVEAVSETRTLNPGIYFVGVLARGSGGRTEYLLVIE